MASSTTNRWLRPEVYPLFATVGVAVGICGMQLEIWEALQKKYDTEEAGTKKYHVSRYMKYQMIDDKSVEAQSHELKKIAHEITFEGSQRKTELLEFLTTLKRIRSILNMASGSSSVTNPLRSCPPLTVSSQIQTRPML